MLVTEFWDHVGPPTPTGCREWQDGRTSGGYGSVCISKPDKAHRVAWRLAHGTLPPGAYVCHTCDNRLCCEPSHLWLGDHASNQADKRAKGRNVSPFHGGELNGMSVLTESLVVAIRQRYAQGDISQAELAHLWSISRPNISLITSGKTWAHAGGPITYGPKLRYRHRSM